MDKVATFWGIVGGVFTVVAFLFGPSLSGNTAKQQSQPDNSKQQSQPDDSNQQRHPQNRRMALALGLGLVAALGTFSVVKVVLSPGPSQSTPVTANSVISGISSPTGAEAASVDITSPKAEALIPDGPGVIIKGTAKNFDGQSLWIFTQGSDGAYWVDNSFPILIDGGQWYFDDPYIGSGGVGPYVINAILANPSCTKAIHSAPPQPDGGGIAFQTLPGGCSIGDKVVVNITP